MPTVAVAETAHYYVEEPSFVGGILLKRGAKIKTHALPSINWRPLNQTAFDQIQRVREESFEYDLHLQDGTVKQMKVQPRLMSKTLGGGRGSLSETHPEAPILEMEDPEPHTGEGMTLAEAAINKGAGKGKSQRPGPAVALGPAAFVPEPSPDAPEPEETETGADGVVVTAAPPRGAGFTAADNATELKTSKGSPIIPTKNGRAE